MKTWTVLLSADHQIALANLTEAKKLYREQLRRGRLFVPCGGAQLPDPATETCVELSIATPPSLIRLEGKVVRHVDATLAAKHSLGDRHGFVLEFDLEGPIAQPLRDFLTGASTTGGRQGVARTVAVTRTVKVDLDDVRRRLDRFEARIERDPTHYGALGLTHASSRSEIQKSYRELIRTFHPDSYFRQLPPALLERLENAYQSVTSAHGVLSNQRRRDKYDIEIGNYSSAAGGTSAAAKKQLADLSTYKQQNASRIKRAKELYDAALRDEAKGNLKAARSKLTLASSFDPRNPLFPRKLAELSDRS